MLTLDQKIIFREILDKISKKPNSSEDSLLLLDGFAGTGKTFLTATLADEISKTKRTKACAPTHKAAGVLRNNLNSEVEVSTIHCHLALKLKENHDNGSVQLFEEDRPIDYVDVLIVDEHSMIDEELFNYIKNNIRTKIKYVLFVGDELQIPPVNGAFSIVDQVPEGNRFKLNKIVRQAEDNPVIKLSQICVKHIRDKSPKELLIRELVLSIKEIGGETVTIKFDELEFIEEFISDAINDLDSSILGYTNSKVTQRNELVREFLINDPKEYVKGEVLIMQESYESGGFRFLNNQEITVQDSILVEKDNNGIAYWNVQTKQGILKIPTRESKVLLEKVLRKLTLDANSASTKEKRNEIWKKYFTFKKKYANVSYRYSSTLHKIQGSTVSNVYLDLTNMERVPDDLFNRLTYVGITRTKANLKILVPESYK
jgi:hypothetical protein